MSDDPITSGLVTARCRLIQCIADFITTLEKCPRDPTPWECEHTLRALRALEELDFARGEQVMMWAAWPVLRHLPAVLAKLRSQYIQMNTAELRVRFEQAVRKTV